MPTYEHLIGRVIKDTWIIKGKPYTYEGYIKSIHMNEGQLLFKIRFADLDEILYTFEELKGTLTNMIHCTKAYFSVIETAKRKDDKIVLFLDLSCYFTMYKKFICSMTDSIKYLEKNEFEKVIIYLKNKYTHARSLRRISKKKYDEKMQKLSFYMLNAASRVVYLDELESKATVY